MKLIVTGATGFVGREVVRQSLAREEITSVVAVARAPVAAPAAELLEPGADPSKLRSVVLRDYCEYTEQARSEFAGASACIWTVAITPSKASLYDFDEVRRVCQTSTLEGLRAMHAAGPAAPSFRFVYMSGAGDAQDPTKPPWFRPEYSLMRGETVTKVHALAAELSSSSSSSSSNSSSVTISAGTVKPGLITAPPGAQPLWRTALLVPLVRVFAGVPDIAVADLAAVMLDQAVGGFARPVSLPADLRADVEERRRRGRIGRGRGEVVGK
ncbi:putative nucleoside-diphosphate-sugar epimerase [Xylariaceae sp. FL0804]|nr:putative nucleoside-diphosphate-sugar epimerase [Xylariaceae sp. FL0804]